MNSSDLDVVGWGARLNEQVIVGTAHAPAPSSLTRISFDGIRLGESMSSAAKHLGGAVRNPCGFGANDTIAGVPAKTMISDQYGRKGVVGWIETSQAATSGPKGIRVGMTLAQAKKRAGAGLQHYYGPATGFTLYYLHHPGSTFAFPAYPGSKKVALIGIYKKKSAALSSVASGWSGC